MLLTNKTSRSLQPHTPMGMANVLFVLLCRYMQSIMWTLSMVNIDWKAIGNYQRSNMNTCAFEKSSCSNQMHVS